MKKGREETTSKHNIFIVKRTKYSFVHISGLYKSEQHYGHD